MAIINTWVENYTTSTTDLAKPGTPSATVQGGISYCHEQGVPLHRFGRHRMAMFKSSRMHINTTSTGFSPVPSHVIVTG